MMVIASVGIIYMSFGMLCTAAWGNEIIGPLITDKLPQPPNPSIWISWLIKILFSVNLVISFPLIMYPVNIIVESYMFSNWAKTKKR
jgi:hypothetical protein